MSIRCRSLTVALAAALALSGCKTSPPQTASGGCQPLPGESDTTKAAVVGGAIGAVAGAVIGRSTASKKSVGTRNGALLGAVTGAVAGTAYSKYVSQSADGTVKLDVPGSVLFPTGSYQLSSNFKQALSGVAGTITKYCGVTGEVIGHTDNVGSYNANMTLSRNRAQAVVAYLASQGVDAALLSSDGRADSEPVAPNTDESGRQQNRRVEIFVRPPATP